MALNIKDDETHRLARELAAATGESLTAAVRGAIVDKLDRVRRRGAAGSSGSLADRLDGIARHAASLPVRRSRTEDEILGYDEKGLPRSW